jgi:hypothetical protein
MKVAGHARSWDGQRTIGKEEMTLRKRIERREKEVGECGEWIRSGTSPVALAAMSDPDVQQLRTITALQIEPPEAVFAEIAAASMVEFGFADPRLMVSTAGIVADQKRGYGDAD